MCGLKDIILSGLQDLKVHKKNNRISFILIFLALVTYVGVNSHINSLNESMQASLDFFESRIILDSVPEDEAEEKLEKLEELYGEDERIREMCICTTAIQMKWIDAVDVLYVPTGNVDIQRCYEAIFDYDYKGEKRVPEENEIIMPRYLCSVGIYDTKNLGDGDALIGQTVKLKYKTAKARYVEEYGFKVIGTYDNLLARASSCICIVNPQLPVDLLMLQYREEEDFKEDTEKELQQILGEDYVYEVDKNVYIGMFLETGYDAEELILEIEETTKGEYLFTRYKIFDPSMQGYFEYVMQIGNIISVMLLMISVINIIISSINEVKERKWEFALKMSAGYTRSDIIGIFFVEKVANLLKGLLLSLFAVGLYCIVATYISSHFLEYWKREYVYTIYPQNVVVALLLVIIAGLIGTLCGRLLIHNISVAKELKTD